MEKTIEGVVYNSDKLIAEIVGYDDKIKQLKTRKDKNDVVVVAAKKKYTEHKKTTDTLKKEWKDSGKGLGRGDTRIINLTTARKATAKLFSNIFSSARNEKDESKRLGFKKEYDLAVSKTTKTKTPPPPPPAKPPPPVPEKKSWL